MTALLYLMIIILVVAIIVALFKVIRYIVNTVLFNPIVNSAITLIISLLLLVLYKNFGFVLVIIDCIMDIVRARNYYYYFKIGYEYSTIDTLYRIKSLTSLFTYGYARIIFLFVVHPVLRHIVVSDMDKKLKAGYPMPPYKNYSLQAKTYYYRKHLDLLEKRGEVISNIQTVNDEIEKRRMKLAGMYPKKFIGKFIDTVMGDKAIKAKREDAEKKLSGYGSDAHAYISTSVYLRYPQVIMEAMSTKAKVALSGVLSFDELAPFKLPLETSNSAPYEWLEYFIIQSLQPLVISGAFEDEDVLDNDVFDNHIYRYVNSTKQPNVLNPVNCPALALDDD